MPADDHRKSLDLQQWSLDLAKELVEQGAADRRQMIDRWNEAPQILRREFDREVHQTLQEAAGVNPWETDDEATANDPQQT